MDPPEVAFLDEDEPRAATSLNSELRHSSAHASGRRTRGNRSTGSRSKDCSRFRAEAKTALPLVVFVHGGPTGTWSWSYPHPTVPLLSQEGYAVLFPNPRGSSGRGQEFARANLGDMGGGDLQDILAGIDSLVRDGIVDDARVAITGGSYGGFMAAWAVTQTDRFAAAMPFAVVTNWTSFHYTTNIGHFDTLFLQGDPNDPTGPYPSARRSSTRKGARRRR